MTVFAFYASHAIDGRAPLRKTDREPTAWVSRAQTRGYCTYWLCHRDMIEIQLLDPLDDATRLRPTRPYRKSLDSAETM